MLDGWEIKSERPKRFRYDGGSEKYLKKEPKELPGGPDQRGDM